jgi:putative peptide zinc metalloprotease protein
MSEYPDDASVHVYPFTHRLEDDSVVLGDPQRDVFICVPPEGLEILRLLADGRSVGETRAELFARSGEQVDVADFLGELENHGFVIPGTVELDDHHQHGNRVNASSWGLTLPWLTPRMCRAMVSVPALIVCGLLIAGGFALLGDDAGIMPTPASLLFPIDFVPLAWGLFFIAVFSVFLHEVGHLAVARAAGYPAKIRISNRLYVLVAETDMSGLWLAPKRTRYLAFMIGSIIDAASAALVVGFLWLSQHGWIDPPRWMPLLASALLLAYGTRLVWQWFFFLRTDGYYVIATAFGCKNLLSDTGNFLRNMIARALRRPAPIDQSGIPRKEMRVVYAYSVLWFIGRLIALGVYFGVGLPVLWGYFYQFLLYLAGEHSKFSGIDYATVVVIGYLTDGSGFMVWIWSLCRRGLAASRARRARRELAGHFSLEAVIPAEAKVAHENG